MGEKDEKDMEPWDPWSRRRRMFDSFFDFDEIDKEFERMRRYMDAMMQRAVKENQSPNPNEHRYVYGFTMNMGPDGRPVIREFGNTRPTLRSPELAGVREPIIDMNETESCIAITAELPGVEKEDVELTINEDSIVIEAKGEPFQYYKRIELQTPVDPERSSATCKNGILDIQVPKVEKRESKGHKINIE